MAVEAKRGCGYRKVGGLYLVSGELSESCDRLPFELSTCPCCGEGIKQARGWTWIEPNRLFESFHESCICSNFCPVCNPHTIFYNPETEKSDKKAGLIWIGKQHYPTTRDFIKEGVSQGVSRRINSIHRGFELGKTWVLLAHPEAVTRLPTEDEVEKTDADLFNGNANIEVPGIFCVFKPTRIERIIKQSEYDIWNEISTWIKRQPDLETDLKAVFEDVKRFYASKFDIYEKHQRDIDRGITLVPVPDDDKDHQ